jgi:ABC-type branched-subunit amino acid transport system ATPase component/branched-subunit amino acid ABC-type transport system permease component
MQQVLDIALLGAGLGAMYALTAQGLVLIYRGSGVLNFAHGGVAIAATYLWYELHYNAGWSYFTALIAALVAGFVVGALIHLLIMRPLRGASPLARTVATLGLLVTIQSIVVLRYGTVVETVPQSLPLTVTTVLGVRVPEDRMILLGIAIALSLVLWAVYRFTNFGRSTSAVAENQFAAATVGISPDAIAAINWGVGSALAALAGILVAPIIDLQVSSITTLMLAALAAALVAGFNSFAIVMVASLVVGIGQAELTRWVTNPDLVGLGPSLPFALIIVVMMVRGQAIPLRDFLLERLPAVGSGRIRPLPAMLGLIVAVTLISVMSPSWAQAFGLTYGFAAFMLSFVILLGYSGQVSLAQWAVAGFGAWVAGRMISGLGLSLVPAAIIAVVATVPAGLVFALPAVRTRGINLAIATFGLATALEVMIFDNPSLTGGFFGTTINLKAFGWSFDTAVHPHRYALVTLGCFSVLALLVANVRRGIMGRRMLSVRNNERAAVALGINVPVVKLYAFGLAAAIAAVGGIITSAAPGSINYTQFAAFGSVLYMGLAFLGGIGFIFGPLVGATLASGTVGSQFGAVVVPGLDKYLGLIGGVSLVLVVLANQDGVVAQSVQQLRSAGRMVVRLIPDEVQRMRDRPLVRRLVGSVEPPSGLGVASGTSSPASTRKVDAKTLDVRSATVRYGAVTALSDVSLTVRPGRITGLIGPNGAGKTTLIDAITGFTKTSAGDILLNGVDISQLSPRVRARAGIARSFQSLELFEDMTVLENIHAASDSQDWRYGLTDVVWPRQSRFTPELASVVDEFQLTDELATPAASLPYGHRRLLAIARAVASGPNILLLDEPAAGLSGVELRELAAVVRRLARDRGIAILLIEHDMEFVFETCDDLVAIDAGRMIASGSPSEVRTDPAVISAYLGGGTAADQREPSATG